MYGSLDRDRKEQHTPSKNSNRQIYSETHADKPMATTHTLHCTYCICFIIIIINIIITVKSKGNLIGTQNKEQQFINVCLLICYLFF